MFAQCVFRGLLPVAMLSISFATISAVAGEVNSASSPPPVHSKGAARRSADTMKITIKVAGKELHATLADNPTAREFAALLPLHVSMEDLFGREKAGPLPREISTGGPRSDVYKVGDIGYWSPGHDVAIYYRQDGERIPAPGIINIGHVDAGIEAFERQGALDVTIEQTR
ncbi:hypothetical protein CUJ88_49125 (plasmid) [Paraburkholderia hospita]|nr:hypothetical protein CUJ88_49125 [Paraburkholderia hospita]